MANPHKTPPHSDIDGVDEDRMRIDHPDNADSRVRQEAALRRKESIGKPDVDSVTTKETTK
jgi:hypothetical protein